MSTDRALHHEVVLAAETIVRTFERERFAPSTPSNADLMWAREETQRMRELV